MTDYLQVVYDEESHPYTSYPMELCIHLFNKYKMKEGMKLLEPGCGRGEFLLNFKELGLEVSGLDISDDAQRLSKDLPVSICNLETESIPFPDNYFDFIYSKSFLEHLRCPDNYLTEAYRVLKPGGVLLTLVPDWESNYKIYYDDYTHVTPYTFISLNDLYKIFKFKEIDVIKFRQLPIVWKYPFLNYISAIISPFIPVRTKNKFLRWSRELMLVGKGVKPKVKNQ